MHTKSTVIFQIWNFITKYGIGREDFVETGYKQKLGEQRFVEIPFSKYGIRLPNKEFAGRILWRLDASGN